MSKKEAIVESKHYQPNSTAFQLVASAKKSLDKKKQGAYNPRVTENPECCRDATNV